VEGSPGSMVGLWSVEIWTIAAHATRFMKAPSLPPPLPEHLKPSIAAANVAFEFIAIKTAAPRSWLLSPSARSLQSLDFDVYLGHFSQHKVYVASDAVYEAYGVMRTRYSQTLRECLDAELAGTGGWK